MAVFTPAPSDTQSDSNAMRLLYFSNEFPHDDLQGVLRNIHRHSTDRQHPILARFLDEATLAIREELRQLPAVLRDLFPPFETVLNLADFADLRKSRLCGSIDGVLLCTLELGLLIG